MATQEWTIFTIVGKALPEIEGRLQRWSATRIGKDEAAWSLAEWPQRTRSSAARLMGELERHNSAPPVVYFSRHIDLWSSFGELFRFVPQGPPLVAYVDGEVWVYRLPDRGKLVRRAQRARSDHQFQESVWLANALEAAAKAYQGLWRKALVLVQRRVWDASPTDDELTTAASVRPKWLGRSGADRVYRLQHGRR